MDRRWHVSHGGNAKQTAESRESLRGPAQTGHELLQCCLQLVADLFAFPRGCFGERYTGVGDHSGDKLCYCFYGEVVAVNTGVDEVLQ